MWDTSPGFKHRGKKQRRVEMTGTLRWEGFRKIWAKTREGEACRLEGETSYRCSV